MAGRLILIGLVICMSRLGHCYPWGPPATVCGSMMPSHGFNAQVSPSPYSISVSPTTYHQGDKITVTIDGGSTKFKGFMLQARPVGTETHIGIFNTPMNTKSLSCGEGLATTHSTRLDLTSITLQWTAPFDSRGDIQVIATIVQKRSKFWVKVEAAVLLTEIAVMKLVPGCFLPVKKFSLCERSQEKAEVSWENVPNCGGIPEVQFTVKVAIGTSTTNQWVAIGFSEDDEMGDDSVVDCIQQGVVPTINVQSSRNVVNPNNNVVNNPPALGVTKVSASLVNGVMECIFKRKVNVENPGFFDLGARTYRLLVARGTVNSDDFKTIHDLSPTRRPLVSTEEMNFLIPGVFTTDN